ncbi:hypothetical protein [Bdellovibrio bacteriovorus]|uniref:hypothetical protein n=1 Tax=Bdellovibrio bacteriovorus TaxID=959 RepID=UPI0035A69973
MKSSIKALSLLMAFAMVTACGNESTKLVPKAKINKEEVSEKPADFAIFNPKVDILFVIDNSASMDNAQSNLSRNAAAFCRRYFQGVHFGLPHWCSDDRYVLQLFQQAGCLWQIGGDSFLCAKHDSGSGEHAGAQDHGGYRRGL